MNASLVTRTWIAKTPLFQLLLRGSEQFVACAKTQRVQSFTLHLVCSAGEKGTSFSILGNSVQTSPANQEQNNKSLENAVCLVPNQLRASLSRGGGGLLKFEINSLLAFYEPLANVCCWRISSSKLPWNSLKRQFSSNLRSTPFERGEESICRARGGYLAPIRCHPSFI